MYFIAFCYLVVFTSMGYARTFVPSASCFEESHCPDDHYCELSGSYCRQCLQCKDFKRQAPATAICVTAVSKCGPCLTGYVEKEECVPPEAWWEHLNYNWLISALVLVALIACVAFVCVLRKFRVYTLRATASSTKQSVSDMSLAATAPAPPPPYNCVTSLPASELQTLERDVSPPQLIRPLLSGLNACEKSEQQRATMFQPPVYEGEDNMPPRYENATRDASNQLVHQESSNNLSNNSVTARIRLTVTPESLVVEIVVDVPSSPTKIILPLS